MDESRITIGSQWREVDARFNRFVEVLEVKPGATKSVLICTVDLTTGARGRKNWASKARFDGRRGNYEYWVTA